MLSKSFELNEKDLKAIVRQIIIIYTPVIYLFLEQFQTGDVDYRLILALWVSTTADILRRFLTNYKDESNATW